MPAKALALNRFGGSASFGISFSGLRQTPHGVDNTESRPDQSQKRNQTENDPNRRYSPLLVGLLHGWAQAFTVDKMTSAVTPEIGRFILRARFRERPADRFCRAFSVNRDGGRFFEPSAS
jgi:hypothetical protein